MKSPAFALALLFLLLPLVQAAPPALPIDQALKLAQDHLNGRGLAGDHYIGSLTLEDSTFNSSEKYWFARWVPSIKADQKSESGLRINMDGSLVRLTSGGAAAARNDAPGQRRVGARSIR